MSRNHGKRILALLLAAMTLLAACTAAPPDEPDGQTPPPSGEDSAVTPEPTPEPEPAPADGSPRYPVEWAKDAVIYEVNVRQYTKEGTFAAFSEHLDTLKDMGVTTLWFMPVYPISETKRSGVLGSYYSITDYCGVNPEFGTKEDFKALVDQAHGMGFTIMLDWVANHTGWDCAWITDHPDWYTKDSSGNITDPPGMGWPDVADLDFSNMEMRAEMISCMKYWVEEFDIDGFRCDYANGVPTDFWEDARRELETVKPLLMLAEDNKVVSLLNYAFDMNYNWEMYDALLGIARDTKGANVIRYYIPEDYPDGTYRLNFMDNHDKNSYEHTIMDAIGEDALPAMFSLIYTIPGAPLIYTGDEVGLDHNIAFTERDPIDWDTGHDYRALLAELGAIRSGNPALYSGNYGGAISYVDLGKKSVFAFSREKDGNTIVCLFNLVKRETQVDVSGLFDGTETVLLHGQGADVLDMEDYPIDVSGEVTLQPWEFWIVSRG